jgi:CRP-like cAMP-binding protein/small-conductance mechanosensitive channel
MALLTTYGFVAISAGLVLVAFAVHRFAPAHRRRIRHALRLYLAYVALTLVAHALGRSHEDPLPSWAEHSLLVAHVLGALTVAHLAVTIVSVLVLPRVGVVVGSIATDLAAGLLYLSVTIGALAAEHVQTSSVVVTSVVVSGVLAIGLQATLGNVVAGVALKLEGSMQEGDWVRLADGTVGLVLAIRWRHTEMRTGTWDTLYVSNSSLLGQNLLLFGKRAGQPLQRRMLVPFQVDFRHPPTRVIDAVTRALAAAPIDCVAEDPQPTVLCYDLAKDGRHSFGQYAVRYVLTDVANDDPTNSIIRARVRAALQRVGIPLARPSATLFLQAEEAAAERAERNKKQRLHVLEQVDLFRALTHEERDFVAPHFVHAPFTEGETITEQGTIARWLYVLTAGRVELRRRLDGARNGKAVAQLEAPDLFGELGVMTGEPRAMSVVALTDVECYRLDREGLRRLLEERPGAAHPFSETLARRRMELDAALDLDADAREAKMRNEQSRILDKIQVFFGLERTTRV